MLRATLNQVRFLDGEQEVACHPRSFDKGQQIEQSAHIQELVHQKAKARQGRYQDRLITAVPSSATLLEKAAKEGYSLKSITQGLILLFEDYGAKSLDEAILETLQQAPFTPTQYVSRLRNDVITIVSRPL